MEFVELRLALEAGVACRVNGRGESLAEVDTDESEEEKEDDGWFDHPAPIPEETASDVDCAQQHCADYAEQVVFGEEGADGFAGVSRLERSEECWGNEEGKEDDCSEPCRDGGEFEELEEVAHQGVLTQYALEVGVEFIYAKTRIPLDVHGGAGP